eukprot:15433158-Alexandrium_andersonii.AAC.1
MGKTRAHAEWVLGQCGTRRVVLEGGGKAVEVSSLWRAPRQRSLPKVPHVWRAEGGEGSRPAAPEAAHHAVDLHAGV